MLFPAPKLHLVASRFFDIFFRAFPFLLSLITVFLRLNRRGLDVAFYASSVIDEIWIRTTLIECRKQGLRCALLFGGEKTNIQPYYAFDKETPVEWIHPRLLPFVKCSLFITASSGLSRESMPKKALQRIHMPHSLVSLHMAYPLGTFNGYDLIFACGEHHVQEVTKMKALYKEFSASAIPVGYGKDELLNKPRSSKATPLANREPDTVEVVIAPSWGNGNILESIGENLVTMLLNNGFRVTVRPHPMFFSKGHALFLKNFRERHTSHPHFSLENPQTCNDSLLRADIMISDYSGVAMEFAFSRLRPTLFVNVPIKQLNPHWRELDIFPVELSLRSKIGLLVEPSIDEVLHALEILIEQKGKLSSEIVLLRQRHVFNYGTCALTATRHIINLLKTLGGSEPHERNRGFICHKQ